MDLTIVPNTLPTPTRTPTDPTPPTPSVPTPTTSSTSPRRSRPARAVAPPTTLTSTTTQPESGEETCPICVTLAYKKKRGAGKDGKVIWVECDKCNIWYHWFCASPNPLDSIDLIDKWFCPPCSSLHSLSTTYKAAPRKSLRSVPSIDYKNLHSHLPADVGKWERVLKTRRIVEEGGYEIMGSEMLGEGKVGWVYEEGAWERPVLVRGVEGEGRGDLEAMGMKMPKKDIKVSEISQLVGPKTPIEVIDVASQSSLSNWTVAQWATYYEDPTRDKVRNVISLEVSESVLAEQVVAPGIVRHLDWVDNIWPNDKKGKGEYPTVQKYCLMSVEKCWTDWHIDFAGSSVFYHVLRGGKIFYFIRPTDQNLAAYERWSGSVERQENTWLGDEVDTVYKVELHQGDTMIIPTGWIHAVYTPCDSLVFGGNFLHSLNISTQLKIYQIELATKVPKKFRFPQFVRLLWYTARHYSDELGSIFQGSDKPTLPTHLPKRVLLGLKDLSAFLIEQTTRFDKNANVSNERRRVAKENVPVEITNPVALTLEFRKLVLRALGEEEDELCSERVLPVKMELGETERSATPSSVNGKRKADSTASSIDTEAPPSSKHKPNSDSPSTSSKAIKSTPTNIKPKSTPNGPSSSKSIDASILSRKVIPVQTKITNELRGDPGKVEMGERMAEVKKTESTTEVVRRLVEENGEIVLETRTVVTKVERVKWIEAEQEKEKVSPPKSRPLNTTPKATPPGPPTVLAHPPALVPPIIPSVLAPPPHPDSYSPLPTYQKMAPPPPHPAYYQGSPPQHQHSTNGFAPSPHTPAYPHPHTHPQPHPHAPQYPHPPSPTMPMNGYDHSHPRYFAPPFSAYSTMPTHFSQHPTPPPPPQSYPHPHPHSHGPPSGQYEVLPRISTGSVNGSGSPQMGSPHEQWPGHGQSRTR